VGIVCSCLATWLVWLSEVAWSAVLAVTASVVRQAVAHLLLRGQQWVGQSVAGLGVADGGNFQVRNYREADK
jgi:hypothetical protein